MSDENPHFVRDALGRPLSIGDKVIQTNGEPPMVTVVDIRPFLHPKAPPGAVVVVFQNTFKFVAEDGGVLEHFLRYLSVAEIAMADKTDQTSEKSPIELTDLDTGEG